MSDAARAEKWREDLWLAHGCVGIYGDDGEMQCGSCLIDFKRDAATQIGRRLAARWSHATASLAAQQTRAAAAEAQVERLRAGIAEHECGAGPGTLWCGQHHAYHRSDIDSLLADPSVPPSGEPR